MHYTFSSVTEKAIQKIVLVLLNPFYFQNLSVQNIVPGKLPYTCFLNWFFCFIIYFYTNYQPYRLLYCILFTKDN